MLAFVKIRPDPEDGIIYCCKYCSISIAASRDLAQIAGAREHSYTNPTGMKCNFYTFYTCEHVHIHKELYLEFSWFAGYGWRFITCGGCSSHLGWKYDAVTGTVEPTTFFGILKHSVSVTKT